MKKTRYRIGEYRITEYEKGSLWWEAHHGFGVQRSGKCFVHDDILIIGQCIHEEIGYLKGEFLDHLEKLPTWKKTRYYCFAFELLDVGTGRNLKEDVLEQMLSSGNINRAGPEADMNDVPRTYRLDKYQITLAANGELSC
jgi:hypothetical protein